MLGSELGNLSVQSLPPPVGQDNPESVASQGSCWLPGTLCFFPKLLVQVLG